MLRNVHLIRDEVLGEASCKYICSGHGEGAVIWAGRENEPLHYPYAPPRRQRWHTAQNPFYKWAPAKDPAGAQKGWFFPNLSSPLFALTRTGIKIQFTSTQAARLQMFKWVTFYNPLASFRPFGAYHESLPLPSHFTQREMQSVAHTVSVCVFASTRRKCTKKKTYTPPKKKQHTCDVIFGTIDASWHVKTGIHAPPYPMQLVPGWSAAKYGWQNVLKW